MWLTYYIASFFSWSSLRVWFLLFFIFPLWPTVPTFFSFLLRLFFISTPDPEQQKLSSWGPGVSTGKMLLEEIVAWKL